MNDAKHRLIPVTVILLGLLSACASSPSQRLYIMEPMNAIASVQGAQPLRIAVGPVALPAYLDRKEIVTHDRRYQINSAEFDRWAEPPDQNIANTLAENLSILIQSDQVVTYPWDPVRRFDYTVRVRVIRFGASPSGDVELSASWLILNSENVPVKLTRTHYVVDRQGDDMLSLMAAMSNAVEQLSRDIANGLAVDST